MCPGCVNPEQQPHAGFVNSRNGRIQAHDNPGAQVWIGFLDEDLVLRTLVDGSSTFLEHLQRVHPVLKAAWEHQSSFRARGSRGNG